MKPLANVVSLWRVVGLSHFIDYDLLILGSLYATTVVYHVYIIYIAHKEVCWLRIWEEYAYSV